MLNERQTALLGHLQVAEGHYLMQAEIVSALPELYPYDPQMGGFHDSAARLMLTNDIRKINDSDDVEVIIISGSRGVKIATAEEFEQYISSQYAAVFRRLARVRKKEKKGRNNGQMKMTVTVSPVAVNAFSGYKDMRKAAGLKAERVVEVIKALDPRFDAPLLSKIENGVCLPNERQRAAMLALYDVGDNNGQ